MPKLSIITVNLNNAEGLERTIESVVSQTFTDYEFIIIDGGSTDGSVEIIKQYADKITYWVSEPDKGIYNGMNKGIKVAKGEYCQFLNSGDWLFDGTVLSDFFLDTTYTEDLIYGNIYTPEKMYVYPQKLSFYTFYSGSLGHQSTFIKRTLFDTIGLYNEKNRIVSDWQFFVIAIVKNEVTYRKIDRTVCYFVKDGISVNPANKQLIIQEKNKVYERFFSAIIEDYRRFETMENELISYKNSKIIQNIKKIQNKDIYKRIKGIK